MRRSRWKAGEVAALKELTTRYNLYVKQQTELKAAYEAQKNTTISKVADSHPPVQSAPSLQPVSAASISKVEPQTPAVKDIKSSTAPNAMIITINNEDYNLAGKDPGMTLNTFIRSLPGLKGTKRSCGEGGCGACTVVLTDIDPITQKPVSRSINSCLRPIGSCYGKTITTIEGIGGYKKGYHPIQVSHYLVYSLMISSNGLRMPMVRNVGFVHLES